MRTYLLVVIILFFISFNFTQAQVSSSFNGTEKKIKSTHFFSELAKKQKINAGDTYTWQIDVDTKHNKELYIQIKNQFRPISLLKIFTPFVAATSFNNYSIRRRDVPSVEPLFSPRIPTVGITAGVVAAVAIDQHLRQRKESRSRLVLTYYNSIGQVTQVDKRWIRSGRGTALLHGSLCA